MKKYIIIIVLSVFIFNQKIARVERPSSEQFLINQIHQIIASKKAVKIDSFFSERNKRNLFNGTVLFAEKGQLIYKNSFGYADFKDKIPLRDNTAFQLASVTKPLTACAVLMLAEGGKLNLEDDIRDYLPEFPYDGITIRLLLTHRSGLPDYMYFADRIWKSRRIILTNQDMIDLMTLYKPYRYYRPDRRYNYSNTNYALLAALIEKVSGISFADFMKLNIFEPLGMRNTFVYTGEDSQLDVIDNIATGFDHPRRKAENSYLNGIVGDKGIYSTVEDLFRWDQALQNGKLLSLFSLEEAFSPAHKDLRDYDNYGFGWRINLNNGDKIIFHSGWWKGFKTYFIRKVNQEKTIIILTNTANHHFLSIRRLCELL
ncbi:MAG: beta-lactamase family protein [bacterium]|nr:MAG: beta-lactamase family protein [bacterium]